MDQARSSARVRVLVYNDNEYDRKGLEVEGDVHYD